MPKLRQNLLASSGQQNKEYIEEKSVDQRIFKFFKYLCKSPVVIENGSFCCQKKKEMLIYSTLLGIFNFFYLLFARIRFKLSFDDLQKRILEIFTQHASQ